MLGPEAGNHFLLFSQKAEQRRLTGSGQGDAALRSKAVTSVFGHCQPPEKFLVQSLSSLQASLQ